MTTEEYLTARKSKNWKFNTVVDAASFEHVNKIHPIKQRLVREIVEEARKDQAVRKMISLITKGRADVVNLGYLEGTVVEDAVKEGIVVYEYNV